MWPRPSPSCSGRFSFRFSSCRTWNGCFWGWLKSLIQYAFYPVVANAYVFVFGNLLIHFIDSHPPPYDGATLLLLFFPLVLLLIAFTYGIVKIPSLVNSIFTGRSGESGLPRL